MYWDGRTGTNDDIAGGSQQEPLSISRHERITATKKLEVHYADLLQTGLVGQIFDVLRTCCAACFWICCSLYSACFSVVALTGCCTACCTLATTWTEWNLSTIWRAVSRLQFWRLFCTELPSSQRRRLARSPVTSTNFENDQCC